ncbi:MAG: hypothetical protein IPN64_09895 [Propionivibrio sp.]|nr:hypothetical protein [Propionivibrio sp.]
MTGGERDYPVMLTRPIDNPNGMKSTLTALPITTMAAIFPDRGDTTRPKDGSTAGGNAANRKQRLVLRRKRQPRHEQTSDQKPGHRANKRTGNPTFRSDHRTAVMRTQGKQHQGQGHVAKQLDGMQNDSR